MKDTSATGRVGRYQLLEPIGVGCCGAVARAKVFGVAGFERQFAVKKFHTELTATAAMAQALSTAARAYGSLEHPRIARMSEFGVAQGTTFTAVEFVAGMDALRLISEAKLSGVTLAAGGSLTLISQAARAVGYAHGRGLTHLGLAPTNVIVTADGDIKITDFGVLAATLPARPTEVARLANRIAYLAPEQLVGEATSAATDVFALGVIAYELVTGQRAFRGETPAKIAQAILTGPPPEPPLPRPIVRVLQRCLARSPFERFPDARALADALDAALRVAPVPGTRKDIGAQVKDTIDRLAALNDGGMSGMVALNIGTGPVRRIDQPEVRTLGREVEAESSTHEFVRADEKPASTPPPVPEPPRMISIATTPGVAPPIPVPPGVIGALPATAPASTNPRPQPKSVPPIGVPTVVPMVPAVAAARLATRDLERLPRPLSSPQFTPDGLGPAQPAGESPPAVELEMEVDFPTTIGMAVAPSRAHSVSWAPLTAEMSNSFASKLSQTSTRPTGEIEPLVAEVVASELAQRAEAEAQNPPAQPGAAPTRPTPSPGLTEAAPIRPTPQPRPATPLPGMTPHRPTSEILPASGLATPGAPVPSTTPGIAPAARPSTPSTPPIPQPKPIAQPPLAPPEPMLADDDDDEPKRSPLPWIIGGILGLGVLGFVGWQVWDVMSDDGLPVVTAKRPINAVTDASVAAAGPDAAVATATDARAVAKSEKATDATVVAAVDAGSGPVDAALAPAPKDAATVANGSTDTLIIDSTPRGAHVFLDGADQGVTPAKLGGSSDHHNLALVLAGHDLFLGPVDGHGTFTIPLKEVTPHGGPAGIKVLKCKADRYYVFVDGKPTGQTCPTERIETDVGPHVVEVYDAVTEQRRKFDIIVKDTRLSYRVKIE